MLSDAVDGDAANVRETVTGAGCSAIWTEYKSSGLDAAAAFLRGFQYALMGSESSSCPFSTERMTMS